MVSSLARYSARIQAELTLFLNSIPLRLLTTEEPVSNTGSPSTRYDWKLGIFQYTFGLAITFVGLTAVDGSNLSLLSKMSPQRLRGLFLNIGTITTFLSLFARLSADAVVMVDLSHKLINTDIVNALVIPLFLVCFVPIYLVKKHYFFLL